MSEKDERPRCVCGVRFDPYGPNVKHNQLPEGEKRHAYDKTCGRCEGPVEMRTEVERASSSGYDWWYQCPKDGWVSA